MDYDNNNVFAKILRDELPSHKIYEDEHTFVMMDIMPESEGHILVLTKEEASTMFDMSIEAIHHCMNTIKKVSSALMEVTKADGLSIHQFNHECAGQTVFHVHYHVIPRYIGVDKKAHARHQGDPEQLTAMAKLIAAEIEKQAN